MSCCISCPRCLQGTTNRINYWDVGFQLTTDVNYTITPGDTLHTHCYYDTSVRACMRACVERCADDCVYCTAVVADCSDTHCSALLCATLYALLGSDPVSLCCLNAAALGRSERTVRIWQSR